MLFLKETFSQCFIDILSFKFLKNLSGLSFQMPSLSKLLFAFIREFILCCGNGVVHLIEVEGMFRKKKNRESQALLNGFSGWKILKKDVVQLMYIFLSDQIHHSTRTSRICGPCMDRLITDKAHQTLLTLP